MPLFPLFASYSLTVGVPDNLQPWFSNNVWKSRKSNFFPDHFCISPRNRRQLKLWSLLQMRKTLPKTRLAKSTKGLRYWPPFVLNGKKWYSRFACCVIGWSLIFFIDHWLMTCNPPSVKFTTNWPLQLQKHYRLINISNCIRHW